MKINKKFLIILFLVIGVVLISSSVSAYTFEDTATFTNTSAQQAGFDESSGNFSSYVADMIQIFLSIVGALFVIMIIYGGFLWMTTGGSSKEKIVQARKIIIYAVIGVLVILLSYTITYFIASTIEGPETAEDTGPAYTCSGVGDCQNTCTVDQQQLDSSFTCPSGQVCCGSSGL